MPLPPVPVDTWRKFAADRWKDATEATIGRVKSGLWDVQATQAIDGLGSQVQEQLARLQEEERQRREEQARQEAEHQRQLEEQQARNRAAISSTVGGALGGIGERVGAGFSGLGQTAQQGYQGLQETATDWTSRADAAIDDLGAGVAAFGESPWGQYLQEPLAPARSTFGAMGEAVERGRQAVPGPLGTVLGALGAPGAGFGQLQEQAAQNVGFTPEQAEAQGRLAGIIAPGLGGYEQGVGRLGQLAVGGLGAIGAAKGALETPGGLGERAAGAVESGLTWAQFGQPVGAVAEGVPYVFRRGGDLLGDLARRYGTPPDETLGIVNAKTYDPTGINPVQGRLAARGAPGRAPGPAMLGPVTPEEAAKIRSGRYGAAYEGPPLSAEPIPPGPGPNGEYTIPHPHGYDMVAPPPAPNTYLSSDGYLFWQRVAAGLPPYRADYERSVRELAQPKYPWDVYTSPPPAPGAPGYGRLDQSPLPAPDWDTRLAGWAPRNGTDPQTLRHLLNRYAMHERFPREAVDDLAPSHPDLATPEARAAAEADLNEALTRAQARRSKNEDRAITSERNTRRAPGEAAEEGAAGTGDGTYSYTSTKGVGPDGEREFHFTSSYEVATAIKMDLDPTVVSWQKGAGPRGRVRLVIDPKYGYDPTNESLMRNSDPGPGSEVIYSPDFLATLTDGSQKVIETKNVGIYDLPAWRIEAKTTAGQRHFEDLWGVGFMMMAEDQLGRPFLRELATADLAALPAGHPLRRVRPGDVADLQQKLLSAAKASRGTKSVADDARLMRAAQHLMDLNASSRYPASVSLDDTRSVEQYLSAARAQAEWHNTLPGEGTTFSVDGQNIPLAPGLGGYMVSVTPASARISYPGHRIHEYRLAQFRHENQRWFDMIPDARVGTFKWTDAQGRAFTDLDISIRAPDGISAAQIANLFRQRAVYNIDASAVDAVRPRNWVGTREFGEREAFEQLRQLLEAATTRALGGARDGGVFPDLRGLGPPSPAGAPAAGGVGRGRPDRAAALGGAGVPGVPGADAGGAQGAGVLGAVGGDQPAPGAGLRPPAPPGLPPDQGGSPALGGAGAAGIASQPGAGPHLGAAFRGAVDALAPAGAAVTRGQRAFDVASGTAGGALAAGTAEEDATWQERAQRFALGSAAGALVGPTGRSALGALARDGDVLGAAAGRAPTPPAPTGRPSLLADAASALASVPLMAPPSLAANLSGGALRTLERVLGQVAEARPIDALFDAGAMLRELPGATRRFPAAVRTGPTPDAPGVTGLPTQGDLLSRPGATPFVATMGTRLNAATDQFWRDLNEAGAGRVAQRRGLGAADAAALRQRAGDFATFGGPNSLVAKKLTEIKGTLNDPTASTAAKAQAFAVQAFAPYIMMPERLLRAAVETTIPAAHAPALYKALKRGDRRAAREATGKAVLSGGVLWALWNAADQGQVTGPAPQDQAERQRREALGEQWETIQTPAGRMPLRYFGAFGQSASLVAALQEAVENGQGEGDGFVDHLGTLSGEAIRWTLDESYLRDFGRFIREAQQGRGGQALAGTLAVTPARIASPIAGLVSAADPYEREVEGIPAQIASRAGARALLPPRIEPATGEPQRRRGSGWSRYWGERGAEATPAGAELARHDLLPRVIDRNDEYAGSKQTPAQRRVLQQAFGSETAKAVRETTATAEYKAADEAEQKRLLERAKARAAEEADIVAGDRVARDAKGQATREWQAVPRYEDVKGTPDEVRRLNARIRRAKTALAEAKKADPRQGEQRFLRERREEYRLADRQPVPADDLRPRREAIERKYGVELS